MAMYAGMLKSSTILYRNDELILANTFGDILVLQKKSYIRKF